MFWGLLNSDTGKVRKQVASLIFIRCFFVGLTFGEKKEVVGFIHGHKVFLKNLEQ